ncbi:MAG: winged helix-turn-helix domain-containing protein [Nitrososphaerales archaeon]
MTRDPLSEVISSHTRLRVADLVSTRPRTLGELAASTGISIQGVLKHLRKMEELGLVEEKSVRGRGLAVRKVYAAKGAKLEDFSADDLTLVKLSWKPPAQTDELNGPVDLEYLAEEAILRRRRIRDQTRRLGRMIDDLVEDESRIKTALESMDLSDTERLILYVIFTEESLEEGERVLSEHFGLQDGKNSIKRALSKARHQAKKRIDP